MADLSKAIEYDREYKVEIIDHITGEPTGITINVISAESRRVVDYLRDKQADQWDKERETGVSIETTRDKLAMLTQHEQNKIAPSIVSWDWGEHSFEHISGSGPASIEDAEFLVNHPHSTWITNQIYARITNIENFTQRLPKSVRTGSKKK